MRWAGLLLEATSSWRQLSFLLICKQALQGFHFCLHLAQREQQMMGVLKVMIAAAKLIWCLDTSLKRGIPVCAPLHFQATKSSCNLFLPLFTSPDTKWLAKAGSITDHCCKAKKRSWLYSNLATDQDPAWTSSGQEAKSDFCISFKKGNMIFTYIKFELRIFEMVGIM